MTRRRAAAAALALLVLVLGLVGCPGLVRPLEPPQVSVRAASVGDGGLTLELSVVNANHEALVLEAVDWQLEADDRAVARGRIEAHVAVAAYATSPVSLRGEAAAAGAAEAVSGTLHLRGERGLVAATFYGPVETDATRASSAVR